VSFLSGVRRCFAITRNFPVEEESKGRASLRAADFCAFADVQQLRGAAKIVRSGRKRRPLPAGIDVAFTLPGTQVRMDCTPGAYP